MQGLFLGYWDCQGTEGDGPMTICPLTCMLLPLNQLMKKRHSEKRPEGTDRIGPSLNALYLCI